MKPSLRQWVVLLEGNPSVSGLHLVLGPLRSRIVDVGLKDLGSEAEYSAIVGKGVISIAIHKDLHANYFAGLLSVSYFEDAPQITAMSWTTDAVPIATDISYAVPADVFAQALALGRGGTRSPLTSGRDNRRAGGATLEDYLWGSLLSYHALPINVVKFARGVTPIPCPVLRPDEIFPTRRQAMEFDERTRKFFLALDVGSMNRDLPPEWQAAIMHVNSQLAMRVDVRSRCGKPRCDGTPEQVPEWPRSPRFARSLREVSMFVQSLILTHFDGTEKGFVDWAFTRFAVESLAVSHPDPCKHLALKSHGAPDGEAFFRFAELALACIEQEVHVAFWTKHLETLVRTAHIYAEHGAEQNLIFEWVYAYQENRRYPLTRLAKVRAIYAEPTARPAKAHLEDLFTSVIGHALEPQRTVHVKTRDIKERAEFKRQHSNIEFGMAAVDFFEATGLFKALQNASAGS